MIEIETPSLWESAHLVSTQVHFLSLNQRKLNNTEGEKNSFIYDQISCKGSYNSLFEAHICRRIILRRFKNPLMANILVGIKYSSVCDHCCVSPIQENHKTGKCCKAEWRNTDRLLFEKGIVDRIVTVATSVAQKVKRNVLPQH